MEILINPTVTGGTSETLNYAGNPVVGKTSFTTPAHSRLSPHVVDFTANVPKTTQADPGVARAALKITFAERVTSEQCCTVQAGSVIIDVGVRWALNQPQALLDEALDTLRAILHTAEFERLVVSGVPPSI